MNIYFLNSLTNKKELFIPNQSGVVNIYSCGMTAYDYCHLGHARSQVFLDILIRTFKLNNYQVNWAQNCTDIDDKIIAKAAEKNISCEQLAANMDWCATVSFNQLNIERPAFTPKASQHIAEIINFIQGLIDKQMAYVTDSAVLFNTAKCKVYGVLSNIKLKENLSQHSVEKKHSSDFVLWKKTPATSPGFTSPWFNSGRPGWHIECSAMAAAIFGQNFDIHTGGLDLKFPHHENEIAQSYGLFSKIPANYWIHFGLLCNPNNQKIAKSSGTSLYLKDILSDWHPNAIRLFFLKSLYCSNQIFTFESLRQAKQNWHSIENYLNGSIAKKITAGEQHTFEQIMSPLNSNLNTPKIVASMMGLLKKKGAQNVLRSVVKALGFKL